jgi:flagellar hook-length control protein FliK
MRGDDASEARIVVEPPALGRIDVSLNSDSRGVEATFKVDNEYLKQMLQNQLDALKTSLQAQGIHVSGLAVDIKNRDDQRGRGDLHGAKGRTRRSAGLDAASDETRDNARLMRLDLERGILHWVA